MPEHKIIAKLCAVAKGVDDGRITGDEDPDPTTTKASRVASATGSLVVNPDDMQKVLSIKIRGSRLLRFLGR